MPPGEQWRDLLKLGRLVILGLATSTVSTLDKFCRLQIFAPLVCRLNVTHIYLRLNFCVLFESRESECQVSLSWFYACNVFGTRTQQLTFVVAFSVMGGTSYISLGMATETDLLFEHPIVLGISQKHQKTAAQVLLRWAIQRNTLPINKSSSLERMKENRGKR